MIIKKQKTTYHPNSRNLGNQNTSKYFLFFYNLTAVVFLNKVKTEKNLLKICFEFLE